MALLDWMMPGQNGVDVCREMRKQRPEPYTYIGSVDILRKR
jgi:DNA-binding response OmpR family regulator